MWSPRPRYLQRGKGVVSKSRRGSGGWPSACSARACRKPPTAKKVARPELADLLFSFAQAVAVHGDFAFAFERPCDPILARAGMLEFAVVVSFPGRAS